MLSGGRNAYNFQAPPLPRNLEKMKECVVAAMSTIDDDMLQRVWDELDYRIYTCRMTRGAHIDYL
jgi:hypothetical protein